MSTWFHRTGETELLFGLRAARLPRGCWQQALRDRSGLEFQSSRAHWLGEYVGEHRFVELAEFLSGRGDSEKWSAPHPCAPLGSLHGLLGIRWRASLPVKKRIRCAEHLCFELRGPVVHMATQEVFDPVRTRSFELAALTSKWGFDDGDLFFHDEEYRAYVHEALQAAGRGAGVTVVRIATSHNPFRTFDAKEARRTRGSSKTVDLWCFDRHRFQESELGYFFSG